MRSSARGPRERLSALEMTASSAASIARTGAHPCQSLVSGRRTMRSWPARTRSSPHLGLFLLPPARDEGPNEPPSAGGDHVRSACVGQPVTIGEGDDALGRFGFIPAAASFARTSFRNSDPRSPAGPARITMAATAGSTTASAAAMPRLDFNIKMAMRSAAIALRPDVGTRGRRAPRSLSAPLRQRILR